MEEFSERIKNEPQELFKKVSIHQITIFSCYSWFRRNSCLF